ncbi:hypothetical protein PVAP13_7KG029900 [Panicum virgatum]|uniref:DUF4220 domain-containing protein n=1 Tax=Panicum virgatum TaxID=38727 RepID=A0A8T0QAH1_PANVG|nr:hypothetical protein PVAP13_7KG029900 [Panicum virgatum]
MPAHQQWSLPLCPQGRTAGLMVEGGAEGWEEAGLVPAVQELWNAWEIHFLILLSLSLQVFLFLFAGMRRRSSSRVLSIVLWLAYLSADSVAIFVLGHLAVRAGEPGHQLMSFWAPFVLIHLGGQDTITAFSRQDNELWLRHLLNLVTQVVVAGYVVAKASWPDSRLRVAMVLMFLSGCFKYAERTLCLYSASPARLRSHNIGIMSRKLQAFQWFLKKDNDSRVVADNDLTPRHIFDYMMKEATSESSSSTDIMSVDAPINETEIIIKYLDKLPDTHKEFLSNPDRYDPYKFVGACLLDWYEGLYTKNPFRQSFFEIYQECLYPFFPLIALVLFMASEKGGHLHTSQTDITVSYILLVGAIFLLPRSWSRKQWSEELAQYNMIKRHATQDTSGMAFIWQWIGKLLGSCGLELFDVTHTPMTKDNNAPMKEFVLANLLYSGTKKEWNIGSSRGHLAVQKWMVKNHHDPNSAATGKVLEKIITSGLDFPTSVLTWHIATDICYFWEGASTCSSGVELKKHKEMSRELSNYLMYLVFKCGVMLSSNSQIVHDKAHEEILTTLFEHQQSQQVTLDEKTTVTKIFEALKKKSLVGTQKKHEEPSEIKDNAADSHLQKLLQSAQATTSPVLPHAGEVAQALIDIQDEANRWELIASVWSEMLFYTAPRCGCAFHYEHLSTGGEFITHVLLLMKFLGPFLPPPGA